MRFKKLSVMGSPPPTRGTLSILAVSDKLCGITPAYAGNTSEPPKCPLPNEDHPRLRGEHVATFSLSDPDMGSPPPTRGTLIYILIFIFFYRITPAYAGNTRHWTTFRLSWRDHPRLRGEHQSLNSMNEPGPGSPPPTRGTLNTFIHCIRE